MALFNLEIVALEVVRNLFQIQKCWAVMAGFASSFFLRKQTENPKQTKFYLWERFLLAVLLVATENWDDIQAEKPYQ